MPIFNRKLKMARSVGLPNISWKDLIKHTRAKIKSYEKYAERWDTPDGPLYYKDNGSNILAVAHLDTKLAPTHTSMLQIDKDKLFFSPTLDDRLGVYTILHYIPQIMKSNIPPYDILLTTGEEKMQSTAKYFKPPANKRYNWMFSFDRHGNDCVLYQFNDKDLRAKLTDASWTIGNGTYSDICDLEHLRCKGINFGVGYFNEHTAQCHMSRNVFMENMIKFTRFWRANCKVALPHTPIYNAYVIGKGFLYYEDPLNSRCFTDEEMDIIEMLEFMGYEFENWITIVRPEDVDDLIIDYQRLIANEAYFRELEKNRKAQFNLFEDKIKVRIGKIPPERLQKMYDDAKFRSGSEDNPEYKKQSRKTGSIAKTSNGVAVEVSHIEKPTINEDFCDAGLDLPMLYDECSTCHKPYQFDPNARTTQCPDCRGENSDAEYFNDKAKVKKIHKVKFTRRKKEDKLYEFDETKQNWFEIGQEVAIPTNRKPRIIIKSKKATV